MAVLNIRTIPDPVLREKSQPVREFDRSLKSTVLDMIDTMFESDGVGIAAPQVGILSRIIICCETAKRGDETVFINPEITQSSGSELGTEGCLSVPETTGDVDRATHITMKAQDLQGKPFEIKAEGLLARIVQHEIDHLNGVLFIDRMKKNHKQSQSHPSATRL
jgi:peptide deformylase